VLVGPHGVPTVHGYVVKNRSLAVYGMPFTLLLLAAGLRLTGAILPDPLHRRQSRPGATSS
jgi:hypothetical protein